MNTILLVLLVVAIVSYFFLKKKNSTQPTINTKVRIDAIHEYPNSPKQSTQLASETRISDVFHEYSELVKEASAFNKAGKYDEAVEKLKDAYTEAKKNKLALTVDDYLKLPPYLQKAKKNDEAWALFNTLIRQVAGDHMSLSGIYDKMRLFRQREGIPKDAIKYAVLSRFHRCLGLHKLVTEMGSDEREEELKNCKARLGDGYDKHLERADCVHLEAELKRIISRHISTFPGVGLPDLVRDIDGMVSKANKT